LNGKVYLSDSVLTLNTRHSYNTMSNNAPLGSSYPGIFNVHERNLHWFHQALTVFGIILATIIIVYKSIKIHLADYTKMDDVLALVGAIFGASVGVDFLYVVSRNNMQTLQQAFEQFLRAQEAFFNTQRSRDEARDLREKERDERDKTLNALLIRYFGSKEASHDDTVLVDVV
jgi:hypothetical protein